MFRLQDKRSRSISICCNLQFPDIFYAKHSKYNYYYFCFNLCVGSHADGVPSINLPLQKNMILLTFLSKCLHVWFTTGYSPSCAALSVQESLLIHVSTLYRKNLVSTKFTGFIVKLIYNGPTIEMGQLLYFKTIQIHTCYSHLKSPFAKSNTCNILAETWMKAWTNTGKQGAEKHVTMYALNFLFYRINMTDSLSALVLPWERSLIYWQACATCCIFRPITKASVRFKGATIQDILPLRSLFH